MTPAQRRRATIPPVPTGEDDDPLGLGEGRTTVGYGSKPEPPNVSVAGVAADRLRSFVERIERLKAEQKSLGEDIKEVRAEAKGAGFDLKTIGIIIKIRAQDADDLAEQDALLDTYKRALGML